MKHWMQRAVLAVFLALSAPLAFAQAFPAKPVHIVVPFPPGGTADVLARLVGQKMSESMGQQVVVENRPGAGTVIATEYVARARPGMAEEWLAEPVFSLLAPSC